MSSVTKLPDTEARYDEASLWIAKMERGLTLEEEQKLCAWMNDSDDNQKLLLEMAAQWDKMDSLSRLSAIFPHQPASKPDSQGFLQKFANWVNPIKHPAYAFSLLVLVAAAIFYGPLKSPEAPITEDRVAYETAVGEQSSILLPDGSHMRLNTDTQVQVAYSSEQRLLRLVRGELNIDVAHDENRPLRVEANGRIVEAVGTAFNVEITDKQEVELVVTEGKVVVTLAELAPAPALTNPASSPAAPPRPIAVSAGHEILLGSADEELKEIEPQEALVKLSWQQGNLVFRGESLEEAMSEVGRYTTVEFVFLDEKSKSVRIAGLFKAGDTANLLSALRENFNVTYEWEGSDRVLLSSL